MSPAEKYIVATHIRYHALRPHISCLVKKYAMYDVNSTLVSVPIAVRISVIIVALPRFSTSSMRI